MPQEKRTVTYDTVLQIEATCFEGILQKFPNHFHDYYVIGFIEAGQRHLCCKNQESMINPGDILLFNPGDVHSCEQVDGKTLYYRALHIRPEIMRKTALEITGREFFPCFPQPVLYRSELACSLQELHGMICEGEPDFIKEELYLFIMGQLIAEYAEPASKSMILEPASLFKPVTEYIETHYAQTVGLDELSRLMNMSKYHFLRSFTRQHGISPYSYLETVRIGKAKKLLEQGVLPVEAALQTGFHDQSHFSKYFKSFIGLTPRQYRKIFLGEASPTHLTERGADE
ncbi:MAG: AraC family transcriptional regulator [Paenibacillaceae bacterium]|jgi:AraC-like DNA-binding protein|nr:AraC family transcriptional regulator [Paenibacillaceae bacterium]